MSRNTSVQTNDGPKMSQIIDGVRCRRHKADEGQPCWRIGSCVSDHDSYAAVCGKRIRAYGHDGKISESSLRSKSAASIPSRRK